MHTCITAQWILKHTYWQETGHVLGIILIAASVIGLLLLLLGCRLSRRRRRWLLIEAEITQFLTKTESNDDGSTTTFYAPEYTYSFNGNTYVESGSYANVKLHSVGTRVSLFIDPERPENFRVKNEEIIGVLIICGILIVLLAVGIVMLIV